MKFHIPIRLPSLSNERRWWLIIKWKEAQKTATWAYMRKALEDPNTSIPPLPVVVTITRIGPRILDDDNLQGACKHVRDQITIGICGGKVGQYDGGDYFTWKYEQRKGKYGVDVVIESRQ